MALHFYFFLSFFSEGMHMCAVGHRVLQPCTLEHARRNAGCGRPPCELVPAHPFTAHRGEEVGSRVRSLSTAKYRSALEQSSPRSRKQPAARQYWPKCAKCATRERLSTFRCESRIGQDTHTHTHTHTHWERQRDKLMISTPRIDTFLMWPSGWYAGWLC